MMAPFENVAFSCAVEPVTSIRWIETQRNFMTLDVAFSSPFNKSFLLFHVCSPTTQVGGWKQHDETKREEIIVHHKTIQLPRMFYYSTFSGELQVWSRLLRAKLQFKEFTFMIITYINRMKGDMRDVSHR